jgi:hypothetical protein
MCVSICLPVCLFDCLFVLFTSLTVCLSVQVPEDVRATNTEKLATYETELSATVEAIAAFEAMKQQQ